EAAGTLCCEALEPGDDLLAWLRTFEVLEVSGHKAQSPLAIANSQAARAFFHQALEEAFAQGRLMMLALRFDNRVIAMLINLLAGEGGFAYKVAYDEAFARYSPGVMLDMEMIQRLHAEGRIRWLDACTDPGVKCFQTLFSGVKPMQQLCI